MCSLVLNKQNKKIGTSGSLSDVAHGDMLARNMCRDIQHWLHNLPDGVWASRKTFFPGGEDNDVLIISSRAGSSWFTFSGGVMKAKYALVGLAICVLMLGYFSYVPSQPSFNGTTPGCGPAGGCHTLQSGILSVQSLGNLQVRVTLTGGTGNVAGELVDSAGTVVTVNNLTSSNPFILTAPRTGRFAVNAGYRNPQRRWDSTHVVFSLTGIGAQEAGTAGVTFRLDQNYPNPFNPTSTIDFAIPHSAFVTLKLYSVEGQEVMTLLAQTMHLGKHSVRLDASSLPNGVYFYRLQAGSYSVTKRLLLLK
jgi:hypothetical protein